MDLHAPWAYFVLMSAVLGMTSLPLFGSIDAAAAPRARHVSIDGLRGFLALGVFVFHLLVTHRFIGTGVWAPPDSAFYASLGPVGVSLFFMITGFLFWSQMLRADGRPSWRALYLGRLFRIAPMYLFVVLVMLGLVWLRTGLQWRESPAQLATSVLQWLALGLVDAQPDVNGERASFILAGVTWTIAYEWGFYASLLATARFARRGRDLVFVSCGLAFCLAGKWLWHVDAAGFAVLFLSGMGVASLLHRGMRPPIPERLASGLALGCLGAVFALSSRPYGSLSALLLALFFYLVCSGATLFGLLGARPAQRLGTISYSLYLMQGLVLTVVFAVAPIRAAAMGSAPAFWAAGVACSGLLLVAAATGWVWIERPGIEWGRRLIARSGHRPLARTALPLAVPVPVATASAELSVPGHRPYKRFP